MGLKRRVLTQTKDQVVTQTKDQKELEELRQTFDKRKQELVDLMNIENRKQLSRTERLEIEALERRIDELKKVK